MSPLMVDIRDHRSGAGLILQRFPTNRVVIPSHIRGASLTRPTVCRKKEKHTETRDIPERILGA